MRADHTSTSRKRELEMKPRSRTIESFVASRNWKRAEERIRLELKSRPDFHWLWERLSTVTYEQRRYSQALKYAEKALSIMPECSLALWDKAGALDMLGRFPEAIEAYEILASRGVEHLTSEPCSEGRSWARGLVADSYYRLGRCLYKLEKTTGAIKAIKRSLEQRGPGVRSIYPIKVVREVLAAIEEKRRAIG